MGGERQPTQQADNRPNPKPDGATPAIDAEVRKFENAGLHAANPPPEQKQCRQRGEDKAAQHWSSQSSEQIFGAKRS